MTNNEHIVHVGELVVLFQSLEFLLRIFLQELPSARPHGIPHGTDQYSFPVGTVLPESEITSYDSLGQLIDKFNLVMADKSLPQIDPKLVELRDALAHGRVSSPYPDKIMRLMKFSKPKAGMVTVTYNEIMTLEWFQSHRDKINYAVDLVHSKLNTFEVVD
jgi:hypothetical protein